MKRWWLGPLVATQIIDSATTLTAGVEREGNPLVAGVWESMGLVGFFAIKVLCVLAVHLMWQWIYRMSEREQKVLVPFCHLMTGCIVALTVGVCVWNSHAIGILG